MRERRLAIWLLAGLALAAFAILVWQTSAPDSEVPPAAQPSGSTETASAERSVAQREPETGERMTVDPQVAHTGAKQDGHVDSERLTGRVVTKADGTPVVGAEVQLLHRDADEFWNLDLEYGRRVDVVATTRSDADGRFAFDVAWGVPYRLQVFARGFASTTVRQCVGGSEIVVRMALGATVEGVVKRADSGEGIAGVPVRVFVRGASVELGTGQTAPDGSFRFANLPPEKVYVAATPTDLESPDWKALEVVEGELYRVEFALETGRTIRGVVTAAATGAPIAGAELSDGWVFRRVVRTGADGRYEMRGVGDRAELHVRAEGYAPQSIALPASATQQDFALVHGGGVVGRFVDESGAPRGDVYAAAGVSYMTRPGMEDTDWLPARIASDGTFSVTGLNPIHRYQLFVRGDGIGTRIYLLPHAIPDGETLDIGDVVVRPGGRLEGRVVDDDGMPVGAVEVSIRGHNEDVGALLGDAQRDVDASRLRLVTQFQSRSGRTAADGTFRFRGLSAGNYRLSVRDADRSWPITSGPWDVRDGEVTSGVEIVLADGLSITGHVGFVGGRSVAGVEELQLAALKEGRGAEWARVDADGAFRIKGLEEGVYRLAALRCPTGWALEPMADVKAGTSNVELVLQPAMTIRGRVVDGEGQGVDANVYVWSPGVSFSEVHHTDAEGRFEVPVHPGFVGRISAQPANGMPFPQASAEDVAAGTTDLVLKLETPTRRR